MSDTRARLMRIRAYLLENTDARHPVSLRELCAGLERAGIESDARAVRRDLAALQENGLDVRSRRGEGKEFFTGERTFEVAELRLLMDMVRASRFLSQARTESLLKKLAGLSGKHERTLLAAPGGGQDSLQAGNEDAFRNIERILSAQQGGKKVSFVYCEYSTKKVLLPRRDGQAYVVNPCMLLYAEDRYYLIADHPAHEGLAHYRLDKMKRLTMLAENAAPQDASFDPAAYARSLFSMYPSEQRWVRLSFDRALIGAMIDRFGSNVPMEQTDERSCSLYAPVRVGAPFFGWVFQFCGGVRILAPQDVRERMLLMLEAARPCVGAWPDEPAKNQI
ncbi:MAG: WYL domain-containing protein [Eubacteriales bacterium]|nr:WYL domain-containing protein [Eubacteriales bacterium]